MKPKYKMKSNRNGNVRNRQKYLTGLDMVKFDMVVTYNPKMQPSDVDAMLCYEGHLAVGEAKFAGTGINHGQSIFRYNMRKYHAAWYYHAESDGERLTSLDLECDLFHRHFGGDWLDHELYIVLSAYHQLMILFGSVYDYPAPRMHPRCSHRAMFGELFIQHCAYVCDTFNAYGVSLVLPRYARDLDPKEYPHISEMISHIKANM